MASPSYGRSIGTPADDVVKGHRLLVAPARIVVKQRAPQLSLELLGGAVRSDTREKGRRAEVASDGVGCPRVGGWEVSLLDVHETSCSEHIDVRCVRIRRTLRPGVGLLARPLVDDLSRDPLPFLLACPKAVASEDREAAST